MMNSFISVVPEENAIFLPVYVITNPGQANLTLPIQPVCRFKTTKCSNPKSNVRFLSPGSLPHPNCWDLLWLDAVSDFVCIATYPLLPVLGFSSMLLLHPCVKHTVRKILQPPCIGVITLDFSPTGQRSWCPLLGQNMLQHFYLHTGQKIKNYLSIHSTS